MRQAIILSMVLAAVGCAAADDDTDDEDLGASESASAPTHNPDNCPGGSGGPEPSGKKPIPDAKDCSQILDPVECRDCCEWNVDKVWGERCRRMPKRTDEQSVRVAPAGRTPRGVAGIVIPTARSRSSRSR